MNAATDVSTQIAQLGPWFHNLHLPGGEQTAPDHFLGDFPSYKWRELEPHLPRDLRGWEILDIGCNAGFYSFEMAKRGGAVLAIDCDEHYLRQARWSAAQMGLTGSVEFRHMQVYDLHQLGRRFDLVLFMGVLYHLRYPLLALDIVAASVKKLLVLQTLTMPGESVVEAPADMDILDRSAMLEIGWPLMAFIEHRLADDPTNWWAPNHAAVLAMLRSTGMRVIGRPAHEIYLAEPGGTESHDARRTAAAEVEAAMGARTPRA